MRSHVNLSSWTSKGNSMTITTLKVKLVRFDGGWMAIPLVRREEMVPYWDNYKAIFAIQAKTKPPKVEHRKGFGDNPHEALGHLIAQFSDEAVKLTRAYVDISDPVTQAHCVFSCRSEYELTT